MKRKIPEGDCKKKKKKERGEATYNKQKTTIDIEKMSIDLLNQKKDMESGVVVVQWATRYLSSLFTGMTIGISFA